MKQKYALSLPTTAQRFVSLTKIRSDCLRNKKAHLSTCHKNSFFYSKHTNLHVPRPGPGRDLLAGCCGGGHRRVGLLRLLHDLRDQVQLLPGEAFVSGSGSGRGQTGRRRLGATGIDTAAGGGGQGCHLVLLPGGTSGATA